MKGRKRRQAKRKPAGGSMAPWLMAGLLVAVAIVVHENRNALTGFARPAASVKIETKTPQTARSLQTVPRPGQRPSGQIRPDEPAFAGTWYFCASRKDNCILENDTILYHGEKIRIADIDAPAIKQAQCEDERKRGSLAKERLRDLLNQGEFTLASSPGQSGARDGSKPRILLRDGKSLGAQLVDEGLARKSGSVRQSWCG